MIRRLTILSCLLFVFFQTSTWSQGFLRANGTRIVNEKGENVLLRGMGLGGWMLQEGYMLRVHNEGQQHRIRARITELIGESRTAEFYNAWLANHMRRIDVDSMKAWGFNSIRLPMHYNLFTLPVEEEPVAGQQTWIEKGFQMTDSLLAWCKSAGIYLILDLHAAPGGQGADLNISDRDPSKPSLWDSEANQQKTIALWKKLAERYVNEPWIGGYDIINEPNWGFEDREDKNGLKEKKNGPLRQLMIDITKAIRSVDNKHIVIIEGNGWGNNYNGVLPVWDNNMVLSFHKYWNYNDQSSIQHILDMREKNGVPVWLGETGENSNVWFTDAVQLLESNNIGWAWWPLKKMGNNNPMQIRSNRGYEKILAYWQGKGEKPTPDEAYAALMELAASTKLENTVIKKDVIDALVRQPVSRVPIPYKSHQVKKETLIAAVDYDLGPNGVAYFDTDTADYHVSTGKRTPGNSGGAYRNDGVDIRADSLDPNTFYITDFKVGEWLQYTIQTTKKGNYNLQLQCAAREPHSVLSLYVNGREYRGEVKEINGWQNVVFSKISLPKGKSILRVRADKGEIDFKHLQFEIAP